MTDLATLLVSWANINSGTGNLAGLETMCDVLAAEFGALPDASVEMIPLPRTPARALRISVRPSAPRQVLLSGHYDTVYAADHPFQSCAFADAGILRGPGVADMKGGLVVMLAALRELERGPAAAHLGYEIILTPDEETGSTHSKALLETAARSRRHLFALVFEPARPNGDLVKSRKGTGVFTVTVHGRGAHAGRDPGAGRNAILALAEVLPRIDAFARGLPGIMVNVGAVRGGGAVNMVPALASADINLRITRTGEDEVFRQGVTAILESINARDGFRAEITGHLNRGPKRCTAFEELLFAEWRKCGRELGLEFSWQDVAGGSDGNLLSAAGLDNLDGLGPVGDHLHSDRECCIVSSLTERAAVAARFLQRVASGEITLPAPQPPAR